MSITILEARQQSSNSIVANNGDWESILMEDIIIEQGDSITMSSAFCDTTENSTNSIFIKEDLVLFIDYLIYQELDPLNIPQSGFRGATKPGLNQTSYTRFWNPGGGPITKGNSPSPLCNWAAPATDNYRINNYTVRFIDINKPMKECSLILEYTSAAGNLSRCILQLPEVKPVNQLKANGNYEQGGTDYVHTMVKLNAVEGCSIGDGIIVKGIADISNIINIQDAVAANIQFQSFGLLGISHTQNIISPFQRHFSVKLPAGRYHPNDLAQFITRATQETGNAVLARSGQLPSPPINDNSVASRIAEGWSGNYTKGEIGADQRGAHFYTDQRYFDFIQPEPLLNPVTGVKQVPENNITTGVLKDRFCFMYSDEGLPDKIPTEVSKQLWSYKNPVLDTSADVPVQTQRTIDLYHMRFIGSSQSLGFSYDEDANRFQIDYSHSPYYLTGGLDEGKVGYANVATTIADPLYVTGGGWTEPEPDYQSEFIGSLGGVMITCLSSAPTTDITKKDLNFFGNIMGFDINDLCVRMSCGSIPLNTALGRVSSYRWSDGLEGGVVGPDYSQMWNYGQPDLSGADLEPLTPFIVIPYKTNNRMIQGANEIRNFLYGRKLTSVFSALSDAITFVESSANPPPPDPGYIWSYPAFGRGWIGDYDTDFSMKDWTVGTEGESTATTYIRARDYAQGTQLSSAYYLVEIGGIFKNKFVGSSYYSKMITGLLNRYYSTGQFTSGSTPFSYTHIGAEPLFIRSLKIRFLNPDGTLATGIGEDNTVILTLEKNTANIQKAMIPMVDNNSTDKQIKAVIKEGGGPNDKSFL